MYAFSTQRISSRPAWSPSMMLGMATLTIVKSSRIMKKPRQRTSRMIHGLRLVWTAACIGSQSREQLAASANWNRALTDGSDKARSAMGHGHDRDHGIDPGRTGKGAAVGDEQALDSMRLVVGADDRCCRVIPHTAGAHLVKADVTHLARFITVTVDLVHVGVDATPLAGPVRYIRALAGEDLFGAGRFQDAYADLDALAHMGEILARQPVIDPAGAVF